MNEKFQITETEQSTYTTIRDCVISAQCKLVQAVNSAMVMAYWEIGKQIYEDCGENERAEYGKSFLAFISDNLTSEFGSGFTVRNLRAMRQFYLCFPKRHTQFAELSWSHYRLLIRISDEKERDFYQSECAKSA